MTKIGIPYMERKSTLYTPMDGELIEDTEGPFTTQKFVLSSDKNLEPKCLMCGLRGNIFVFDGPEKALVFCSARCQTEHEYHGRIGQDTHDIVILDMTRVVWLSFGVLILALGAVWLMQPYLQSIGSLYSRLFEKLLFAH